MEAPALEIYLVVDNARSQALTRAWDRYDDPLVAAVDLYFRPSTDVALVAVYLRSRRDRGRWIGLVVASGVAVIDPARMAEGDRRAFFATYLHSYDVIARDCQNVASAMTALRWHTASHKTGARGTGPEKVIVEAEQPPRAHGTPPGVDPAASAPAVPPLPSLERRDTTLGLGRLRLPDHREALASQPSAEPTGAEGDAPRGPERRLVRNTAQSHQAITEPVPLPPIPRAGSDRDDLERPVPPLGDLEPVDRIDPLDGRARSPAIDYRARSPRETEPMPPPPAALTDTPAVTVRFLRGGQWAPARLRSLSARGAYLVTGAPPRVGDEVHVALDYGELSTLVRGSIYHVTTARDAASTGSSGFAVRFPLEATPGRQRLIELLQRARAQGVVIKPPPSRNAVRFPVRWPVELRGPQACHADALDVSAGGMFISGSAPLGASTITAVVPIDVGDPPIEVRLRVARSVTPVDALNRGLSAGYGLEIVEMSEGDRVRWQRFLTRVERRSGRSVLVGASPQRLEAIARALGDAGYAVTSSADPGTLIRLADVGQLPDVAVIDDSLLERGVSASWLEQMFTARQVPCITVHGDAQRARMVVDRLLAVSAS